jgi:hypothetical protein
VVLAVTAAKTSLVSCGLGTVRGAGVPLGTAVCPTDAADLAAATIAAAATAADCMDRASTLMRRGSGACTPSATPPLLPPPLLLLLSFPAEGGLVPP